MRRELAASLSTQSLTPALTGHGQNVTFRVHPEPQHGRGPVQRAVRLVVASVLSLATCAASLFSCRLGFPSLPRAPSGRGGFRWRSWSWRGSGGGIQSFSSSWLYNCFPWYPLGSSPRPWPHCEPQISTFTPLYRCRFHLLGSHTQLALRCLIAWAFSVTLRSIYWL